MLSGDNGILQKATEAKTNSDNAQIKERIQLAYHSALTGGQGSYTKESLEKELEKEFGENNYNVDDSNNTNWILSAQGQNVTIPAGKEDTTKIIIKSGESNLKNVADLSTLYGETTDFTSVDGVEWQLFLDDETNIYLIAKDYVPQSKLPISENGGQLIKALETCHIKAYFAKGSTLSGAIISNSPWNMGSKSSTITSNPLINRYLRWIKSEQVSDTENPNLKALAYMLDISEWSSFAGKASGSYAIGGATLEMFIASYNAKHEEKISTYSSNISEIESNSNGYKIKWANDSDSSWGDFIRYLDTNDDGVTGKGNMWVRKSTITNNIFCWLASPSSGNPNNLNMISNTGALSHTSIKSNQIGFRPLVAIPKSSLK